MKITRHTMLPPKQFNPYYIIIDVPDEITHNDFLDFISEIETAAGLQYCGIATPKRNHIYAIAHVMRNATHD